MDTVPVRVSPASKLASPAWNSDCPASTWLKKSHPALCRAEHLQGRLRGECEAQLLLFLSCQDYSKGNVISIMGWNCLAHKEPEHD